jgi:AraC-like DNA-binding protein
MVNLHEDEFRTYEGPEHETVQRTRGTVLAGPRARHTVIDTEEQRCLVEVNFELGGAAPFFTVPASATRDELVDLEELWGRDGAVLRERVLEAVTPDQKLQAVEAALLEHLARPSETDPALAFALAAFERGFSVADVTSRLGLLPKRFVRRFREQVGLTPKRFSRVRRLQRVLRAVEKGGHVNWADTAARHGYCDQAHLINDFRELTGITPTAYRARSGEEWNHVPLHSSAA